MTTTQVVETSDTVNNSPIQDYVHPDNHTQPTYEMVWVQTVHRINYYRQLLGVFLGLFSHFFFKIPLPEYLLMIKILTIER